jgi:hypothetical protein
MGHWWNDTDGRNRNSRRRACPSPTLSTINHTWTDQGPNPSLLDDRAAINHLGYDKYAWSIKDCVFARSDFLMAVVIEITICLDLMPCSLVEIYWRFGGTCYPHLLSGPYFRLLYSDSSLGTGCSEWGLDCMSTDPPVYSLIQACIWLWPLFFHKFSFSHSRCLYFYVVQTTKACRW